MGERIAGKQDRPSLIIEDPLRAPKIYIFFAFWPINEKPGFKLFPLVISRRRRRPGDGRYCNAPVRLSVCPSVHLSVCPSRLVFAL